MTDINVRAAEHPRPHRLSRPRVPALGGLRRLRRSHRLLDEFRARVLARLVLLPRDDPQFRRNRERIVRDAERESISIEWDLGLIPDAAD